MITLEVLSGERTGAVFELDQPQLTIGRATSNQVVLSDIHLSGEHGQIFREDDRYIYRDLRSTNGSRVVSGESELTLDGARPETPLRDGDRLLLGSRAAPVVLVCRLRAEDLDGRETVVARRALDEISALQGSVEHDPQRATALYNVGKKLSRSGLELSAVFSALAEALFELMPKATHLAVDLADDVALCRVSTVYIAGRGLPVGQPFGVSRTLVRRVLRDRAAILVENAPVVLGTDSILSASIISGLAVPLWQGDAIRGVLQCDNRAAQGCFTVEDLDLLTAFAAQATLAIENARLVERLRLAEEQLRGEVKYLKGREEGRFTQIIGESGAMREVFRQLEKVIDTRATVCIEGETGTGKEVVASAIHYQGSRRDKLFVAQNCAALPETLLESELFGLKKGAFTGADHDKKGLFELADQGTLFLDEVGDLPLALQVKLLRVLQDGEIRPLGATTSKKVDVRIVCATNRILEAEVERGAFRQDLFYRLRVFPIRLPPLRERAEDIPRLVDHFLKRYSSELNKRVAGVTPEAMAELQSYAWPGNIRELENEIQRLAIQCDPDGFITKELLAPSVRRMSSLVDRIAPKRGTLRERMEAVERWLLAEALREHAGNKTKAAETLGITREGLHKKLTRFEM